MSSSSLGVANVGRGWHNLRAQLKIIARLRLILIMIFMVSRGNIKYGGQGHCLVDRSPGATSDYVSRSSAEFRRFPSRRVSWYLDH